MVRPLVHEPVFGLPRAEAVVVQLVEVVRLGEPRRLGWLVIARIEETSAVLRPGSARELHPFDVVRKVPSGSHLPHFPFLPVRSRGGEAIGQQVAVIADRVPGERHRPVCRQRVGIQQDGRGGLERRQGIQHTLILEPVVFGEEVAPALLERHAVALVVPQLGQAPADRLPLRDPAKIAERDGVLCVHPGLRFRRIVILKPAIRVGNLHAVVVVDGVGLTGRWVHPSRHRGIRRGARRDTGGEKHDTEQRLNNESRAMAHRHPKREHNVEHCADRAR